MKVVLFFLFCCYGVLLCAEDVIDTPGLAPSSVVIARIKLIIDDELMVWDAHSGKPERTLGQFQDPQVLVDLIGLNPGMSLDESDLTERVGQLQRIMETARVWNEILVFVVPPQQAGNKRTVVVSVRTGFSMRFGGGGAWGMVGDDNADGALLAWRVHAGWNRADGIIGRGLQNLGPVWWRVGLGYKNNALDCIGQPDAVWLHEAQTSFEAGFGSYPWSAGGKAVVHGNFSSDDSTSGSLELYPWVQWATLPFQAIADAQFEFVTRVGADAAWFLPEYRLGVRGHLDTTAKLRIGPFTAGIHAGGGVSGNDMPGRFLFGLYDPDENGVRAAYSKTEMQLDHYALVNAELRYCFPQFGLGFISSIGIEPFLFGDFATGGVALTSFASSSLDSGWFGRRFTAFGAGVRLLFGSPVWTDFTFALGMNPAIDGRQGFGYRFIFAARAGF